MAITERPAEDLSSAELFESATNDPPTEPTPAPAAETTEQPTSSPAETETPQAVEARERDEKGRFVAKDGDDNKEAPVTASAQPQAPTAQPPDAHVPSWRLREEREAREAAEARYRQTEARLAQMEAALQQQRQEPEAPAPDIFTDPAAWQGHQRQQWENELATQRFDFSEMLARQSAGDKKVDEALTWAKANLGPSEQMRVRNARHPYGELLRLQDEKKVLSEIGTDPNAYVQRKLEEALNNPEFLAKAVERIKGQAAGPQAPGAKPAPVVQLPPSLSRIAAAAPAHEQMQSTEFSDRALFEHATER